MTLIYCMACGKQISAEAAACPHCGHPQKKPGDEVESWAKRVLVGTVVAAVLAVVVVTVIMKVFPDSAAKRLLDRIFGP